MALSTCKPLKITLLFLGLFISTLPVYSQSNSVMAEFTRFDFSLLNNGLLILPPLLWNIAFMAKVPDYYSTGSVPPVLEMTENILRAATFVYPWFLPMDLTHELFYPGLTVYSVGLGVYFSSWLVLMYFPDLEISKNTFVRLLPAITPILWLVGIGMMSGIPITYSVLSSAFVATHVGEYLCRFDIIRFKY